MNDSNQNYPVFSALAAKYPGNYFGFRQSSARMRIILPTCYSLVSRMQMYMKIIKKISALAVCAILCMLSLRANAEDCSEVSVLLSTPIKELKVEGLMEAGERYESGKCAKRDWELASQYYQRAALGGWEKAALRLTALFAVKNRDPAAALYWAVRNPAILPKACIPAANPVKNTNGFIDELRTWPTEKLTACTYHAGLAARVIERFNHWSNGIYYQIGGNGIHYDAEIIMRVDAKNGTIVWFDSDLEQTVVSQLIRDTNQPRLSTIPSKEEPLFSFWSSGISALREFGSPPSNEPSWSRELIIKVERSMRASGIPIQIGVSQ